MGGTTGADEVRGRRERVEDERRPSKGTEDMDGSRSKGEMRRDGARRSVHLVGVVVVLDVIVDHV